MPLISGPTVVTITTSSQSLFTLLGEALSTETKTVSVVPHAAGVFWAVGEATASSTPADGGFEIDASDGQAGAFEFIVASGTVDMTIIQESAG